MNRVFIIIAAAALLLPALAHAHGDDYVAFDWSVDGYWGTPTVSEVEAAIEAASLEFGVPEGILQGVAHTEQRWHHKPYRVSQDGRRGLFQMTDERIALAADLLEVDVDVVIGDVVQHARGFAALLDSERPWMTGNASEITVGAWRDAIAWTMDLPASFSDQYVDMLFETIADGVIDQTADGEPLTIAPWPIEAAYLGHFAPSAHRNPDYAGAIWNPTSCNYQNASRSGSDVDTVIIHTVQGSYSGAISWFHNCSAYVSAHYVVSTTGAITQVVDEADIGWHVSCWNSFTIGIEHEGYAEDPGTWYTDAMYEASAALTADILDRWSIPADTDHVVGHVDIDPGCNSNGHWDPGPGWDWDYYMDLIGGSSTIDNTELVGYVRHTDLYEADYGVASATVSIDGVGFELTDGSGFYTFDEIGPGDYTICANAPGYQETCRTKTVEFNVTNWGSILIEEAEGDDADDVADDDDDDDTSVSDDDDSEPEGDDDDSDEPADDDDGEDDDDDDEAVVDADRSSYVSRRGGCAATIGGGEAAGTLALALVAGALIRRRENR